MLDTFFFTFTSLLLISEYGLGNEVSIHGDVYSYGILLLELFTGKRPTESEFGEGLGLRRYVDMALPDMVAAVADRHLLQEAKDAEGSTSSSTSIGDMKVACIASILRVGVQCSEEAPTDRMQISDALKRVTGNQRQASETSTLKGDIVPTYGKDYL